MDLILYISIWVRVLTIQSTIDSIRACSKLDSGATTLNGGSEARSVITRD